MKRITLAPLILAADWRRVVLDRYERVAWLLTVSAAVMLVAAHRIRIWED